MKPNDPGVELLSFRQYLAASEGYDLVQREAWERALLVVNTWSTETVTYEDLTGEPAKGMTEADYRAMKARHDW